MLTTEVSELFQLLESPRCSDAEEVKAELLNQLSSVREPWLVRGLVGYVLRTGSTRATDILLRVTDNQARYLLDHLTEGVRSEWRSPAIALLAGLVRLSPIWMHRVGSHGLLREVLKVLVVETDTLTLLNGLLSVVVILPAVPAVVPAHFSYISAVFSRLAAWDWEAASSQGTREHLQLALYALFHTLYGTYPCTLLQYLRNEYSQPSMRDVFNHTVRPMLESVRFHPLLVTGSREVEAGGGRWVNMEQHDVVVECRRFSLEGAHGDCDAGLATPPRLTPSPHIVASAPFRARCHTDRTNTRARGERGEGAAEGERERERGGGSVSAPDLSEAQTQTEAPPCPPPSSAAAISHHLATMPPGGAGWWSAWEGCAGVSAPATPLPAADVDSSEPEPAVEATPENTPVKELRTQFSFPEGASGGGAVRALGRHSGPPSPLRKDASPLPSTAAHDAYQGRLARVLLDRQQADTGQSRRSCESPVRRSLTGQVSQLRPVSQPAGQPTAQLGSQPASQPTIQPASQIVNQLYSQTANQLANQPTRASVPNSPVPMGSGAPPPSADWPIAKPKPTHHHNLPPVQACEGVNGEDREVLELTMRAEGVTSQLQMSSRGAGVEEHWGGEVDECAGAGAGGAGGEACQRREHGLHMPPSASVADLAVRVAKRVRSYSGCVAVGGCAASFPGSRSGAGAGLPSSGACTLRSAGGGRGRGRARSCPELCDAAPRLAHAGTQTVDAWPHPYEYLLADIYQPVAAAAPAAPPPTGTDTQHRELAEVGGGKRRRAPGPCERLDAYLIRVYEGARAAASTSGVERGRTDRVASLAEQLQLTHVQMLYERWRKEVHAERNRRLLGRCRRARGTEEQVRALQNRLQLEREDNEQLRAQLGRVCARLQTLETGGGDIGNVYNERLSQLEDALIEKQQRCSRLEALVAEGRARLAAEGADVQSLRAAVFELRAKLAACAASVEAGSRCAEVVRGLRRELSICTEREARLLAALQQALPVQAEDSAAALRQYREELAAARELAAHHHARLDSALAALADLEAHLAAKDAAIAELKRQTRVVSEEASGRVEAVQDKYRALLNINRELEMRLMRARSQGHPAAPSSSPAAAATGARHPPSHAISAPMPLGDVARVRLLLDTEPHENDSKT